jgi:hypothetical protein|tara:strand:+ start:1992 stop:2267 length:276 start_codon:yes stop_codon:yes gene_type:complete
MRASIIFFIHRLARALGAPPNDADIAVATGCVAAPLAPSPIVSRHHINRASAARALSAFPTIEPVSAFSARTANATGALSRGSESVQRYVS